MKPAYSAHSFWSVDIQHSNSIPYSCVTFSVILAQHFHGKSIIVVYSFIINITNINVIYDFFCVWQMIELEKSSGIVLRFHSKLTDVKKDVSILSKKIKYQGIDSFSVGLKCYSSTLLFLKLLY